ncbi:MAG: histidinol dehydrogenase [Nitrospina sp.]|jgi:histidinol dehydrogenase|nr:histidinol dehydrogenase [Nitrospina sp.]MBT7272937.1 histidinol dehydrogenase [Nitrospina sp.]MBT7521120.1 histidinol dehydrogenase [Nitrospina sp.]
MKIIKYSDSDFRNTLRKVVDRADVDLVVHDATVREILKQIKERGDAALLDFTSRFDQYDLSVEEIRVTPSEVAEAHNNVSDEGVEALKRAAENIREFHEHQKQESWEYEKNGVLLGQNVRPLETVGIYVPGGKASYPSSVLMNAIPAKVAGVKKVVMCSPASKGQCSPDVLVAAEIAGVDSIFKVGGAQAIGAMAYGTNTIPKVDKIVGPGNIFVALAKRMVFGMVDIDMIAGPSEIVIVADDSAHADFIAADLLSQAEHDEQAVPILVTCSEILAQDVVKELKKQTIRLNRQSIIKKSLNDYCCLFVVESLSEAIKVANDIAPEHLELAVKEPRACAEQIRNAGAIFLGHYTPEAVGDYLAGPNHVLPTSGTARFSSPLGVYDFLKRTSIMSYSPEALKKEAPFIRILAEMEHLDAHANAVDLRINKIVEGE